MTEELKEFANTQQGEIQHTPQTPQPMTTTDARLRSMAKAMGISSAQLAHPIFHNYMLNMQSGGYQQGQIGSPMSPNPVPIQPPTSAPQNKMIEAFLALEGGENPFAKAKQLNERGGGGGGGHGGGGGGHGGGGMGGGHAGGFGGHAGTFAGAAGGQGGHFGGTGSVSGGSTTNITNIGGGGSSVSSSPSSAGFGNLLSMFGNSSSKSTSSSSGTTSSGGSSQGSDSSSSDSSPASEPEKEPEKELEKDENKPPVEGAKKYGGPEPEKKEKEQPKMNQDNPNAPSGGAIRKEGGKKRNLVKEACEILERRDSMHPFTNTQINKGLGSALKNYDKQHPYSDDEINKGLSAALDHSQAPSHPTPRTDCPTTPKPEVSARPDKVTVKNPTTGSAGPSASAPAASAPAEAPKKNYAQDAFQQSIDRMKAGKSNLPDQPESGGKGVKKKIKEDFRGFQQNYKQFKQETNKNVPATIRNNNPGAQWPGPSATAYGSTHYHDLSDKQHNKIASFPDKVSGGAAQLDLLNKYADKGDPLNKAIKTWSGGNSSSEYTNKLAGTMGIKPTDKLSSDMVSNPKSGIPLAKAQSKWETGKDYPMDDKQWQDAHDTAFRGTVPSKNPFRSSPNQVASTGGATQGGDLPSMEGGKKSAKLKEGFGDVKPNMTRYPGLHDHFKKVRGREPSDNEKMSMYHASHEISDAHYKKFPDLVPDDNKEKQTQKASTSAPISKASKSEPDANKYPMIAQRRKELQAKASEPSKSEPPKRKKFLGVFEALVVDKNPDQKTGPRIKSGKDSVVAGVPTRDLTDAVIRKEGGGGMGDMQGMASQMMSMAGKGGGGKGGGGSPPPQEPVMGMQSSMIQGGPGKAPQQLQGAQMEGGKKKIKEDNLSLGQTMGTRGKPLGSEKPSVQKVNPPLGQTMGSSKPPGNTSVQGDTPLGQTMGTRGKPGDFESGKPKKKVKEESLMDKAVAILSENRGYGIFR